MNNSIRITATIATVLLLTSCSPRLVGTWSIARYETIVNKGQGVSLTNIGDISFKRNGKGEKKLNFSVLGISEADTSSFNWSKTDNAVTISGTTTDLSKTWIITKNKRKHQVWKATDGNNQVQVLELKR